MTSLQGNLAMPLDSNKETVGDYWEYLSSLTKEQLASCRTINKRDPYEIGQLPFYEVNSTNFCEGCLNMILQAKQRKLDAEAKAKVA